MVRNEGGGMCPGQHPEGSLGRWPRRRGCPCPVMSTALVRAPGAAGDGQFPAPHRWRRDGRVVAGGRDSGLGGCWGSGCFQR